LFCGLIAIDMMARLGLVGTVSLLAIDRNYYSIVKKDP
jgi:hypothetical protein